MRSNRHLQLDLEALADRKQPTALLLTSRERDVTRLAVKG
jgi:hypothetical protein